MENLKTKAETTPGKPPINVEDQRKKEELRRALEALTEGQGAPLPEDVQVLNG
jgi:hypothetical protein